MDDLNDLFFFAQVVANGGFAPAGRALNQPKSKLSRRVAQLEARLGVRLLERSTRRFRVTEVGQAFYERCRSVLTEVERAEAVIAEAHGEPHGTVRFSCPTGLMEEVAPLLPAFLERHPRVKLRVIATNRRVDLIDERVDVALRVRNTLDTDVALTTRTLMRSRRILVASPALARRLGELEDVADLARAPTLTQAEQTGAVTWDFVSSDGQTRSFVHEPRLGSSDFGALRAAALAGLGVALLPEHACWSALHEGQLVKVLSGWYVPAGIIHLVFTARHGLPPGVRALIDHLVENFHTEGSPESA